ncbi:MAG: bifunctional riboflavin kinase/FAD synthetase [Cocleimonas sp.]|nr:bifunctional riboflavin kinase/FAD synthetase [Cocleimonas sp.]
MKLIRELQHQQVITKGCVASIGNFDGLHLGHQKLLDQLTQKAQQLGLPCTLISFEPLPAEFFMATPPSRIYPLRDKVRLLKQLGVDHYLCLRFNEKLANMTAEDFIQRILFDQLNVRYLVVGDDFRFGKQRKGDFKLLQSMGKKVGMEVHDTPTCHALGQRISSSRIRNHLAKGEIDQSIALLGLPYQLSGRVKQGEKRGRTIGFPTLNLSLPAAIAPARGVYAVKVQGLDQVVYQGVANLGTRPTVSGSEVRLETHVFDYHGDAYTQHVTIQLDTFIRAEQRFPSFDVLKQHIINDVETAKAYYEQI